MIPVGFLVVLAAARDVWASVDVLLLLRAEAVDNICDGSVFLSCRLASSVDVLMLFLAMKLQTVIVRPVSRMDLLTAAKNSGLPFIRP